MATTSRFSFGDVVLVPFPFTDQSGTKKRPAFVVSKQMEAVAQLPKSQQQFVSRMLATLLAQAASR